MYIPVDASLYVFGLWCVVGAMANDEDRRLKGIYWLVCLLGINETKRVRHLHAEDLPRLYWHLIWIGDGGCPGETCAIGLSWRKMTRE